VTDGASSVRLVLVAGPSGSGKSRLARHTGCLGFRLDDFYRDADAPGLPRTLGIVDWDDPATWDGDAALAALGTLLARGEVVTPTYSIAESRATGEHRVGLDGARCVLAEGIFAIDLLPLARAAGLACDALYLDRPGALVFWLRLRRDLAGNRKPPLVLLRRGLALWRAQPALKRRALGAGFRPVSMRQALAALQAA
jgi:uridine kinase